MYTEIFTRVEGIDTRSCSKFPFHELSVYMVSTSTELVRSTVLDASLLKKILENADLPAT